jgi:thioredoxin 1|tara:strand:- start:126 stop:608 length:483 start_codon:yes stop_codon:yes gene_type:complete
MVKNINKIYFDKNVYDTSVESGDDIKFLGKKPVVLDFHAKWCGPCKALSPILEELDKEYDGKIDIYKMDIEDELEVAQQFNVMSVPTLVFIPTKGKPAIQAGAPSKDMLKEIIDERLLSEGCGDTTKDKCCGGGCGVSDEKKESPSKLNKIITKIKGIIN